MMKSPKTRASKAVLKARAARDLAAIDGDQAVFRIEEAQRRRMVAEAREQYEELIEVVDDDEFDRALSLRTPERKLRKMSTYTLQLEVRPNQRPPPPQLRHERLERLDRRVHDACVAREHGTLAVAPHVADAGTVVVVVDLCAELKLSRSPPRHRRDVTV